MGDAELTTSEDELLSNLVMKKDVMEQSDNSEDDLLSNVQKRMFEESLQEPIAVRRKKRMIKRKRFLYEDDSDSDENEKKKTQKKSAETLKRNKTSDSVIKPFIPLKHFQNNFRNAAWKKKPTNLSRKKKNTPGRPKALSAMKKKINYAHSNLTQDSSEIHCVNRAKRKSLLAYQARQIIYKTNTRTLDALLFSNGMHRKEVEGDGNCFFRAISQYVGYDHLELRIAICDHLLKYPDEYNCALSNGETSDYGEAVHYLRQPGNWSSGLADALPLAAANTLRREFLIYSSLRDRPTLRIIPSLFDKTSNQVIPLAHIAVPGLDHYDICVKVESNLINVTNSSRQDTERDVTNNETPRKQTASSVETSTTTLPRSNDAMNSQPRVITPRKAATYKSPKRKFRCRKRRVSTPEAWKKNVRKNLRVSGQEYVTTSGKIMRERKLQEQDCGNCRYKCSIKISPEKRRNIFQSFWSLNDYKRQKDFICGTVKVCAPERIRPRATRIRKHTRRFTFNVDGNYVRVCKLFYVKTLDIGEKMVENAIKSSRSGTFTAQDNRGHHKPANKLPEAILSHIRCHIESFPLMDPHYTRKDTHRKFLGSDLNITKMYELYKIDCSNKNIQPAGASKYRKLFCEEYNYSFHMPKKDQCRTCNLYLEKKSNGQLKEGDQDQYNLHIERKLKAREEKTADKILSKAQCDFHTATFDLQAVLHTPCSNVSQVYYKRKLNCYNSSFYSLGDGHGTCYMWNETDAKRGSNEIGTCILKYVMSLPPTIKHVCLYSDNCTGQNRNRIVSAAILHSVITCDNISTIDQKFLEPGHTEMECDSMHAAIEVAKKNTTIYVPSQWDTVVRLARKKKPYTVVPIRHSDILNFKDISKKLFPPSAVDTKGSKLQWMKCKWIQFRSSDPDCMYFKYDFGENEFRCFRMKTKSRKGGMIHLAQSVTQCYSTKLPISSMKKRDLISLCKDGTIPEEYTPYYSNMLCDSGIGDILPEPDLYDEIEDSDNEI